MVGQASPLKIGDTFQTSHGHGPEETAGGLLHASSFKVVGRLPAQGSPWDRAVIIPVEQIWKLHNLPTGHAPEAGSVIGPPFDDAYLTGVPAIVIKPENLAAAYGLRNLFRTEASTAFFPAEVLVGLYQVLGDIRVIRRHAGSRHCRRHRLRHCPASGAPPPVRDASGARSTKGVRVCLYMVLRRDDRQRRRNGRSRLRMDCLPCCGALCYEPDRDRRHDVDWFRRDIAGRACHSDRMRFRVRSRATALPRSLGPSAADDFLSICSSSEYNNIKRLVP